MIQTVAAVGSDLGEGEKVLVTNDLRRDRKIGPIGRRQGNFSCFLKVEVGGPERPGKEQVWPGTIEAQRGLVTDIDLKDNMGWSGVGKTTTPDILWEPPVTTFRG